MDVYLGYTSWLWTPDSGRVLRRLLHLDLVFSLTEEMLASRKAVNLSRGVDHADRRTRLSLQKIELFLASTVSSRSHEL
ncbi:MAG: hypothetical protein KDJ71_12340 [Nitrobacter sp.]|nr:hypothetical protein [Nitrobacter sp.]